MRLSQLTEADMLMQFKSDINNVWRRNKNTIEDGFNDGFATCTLASYVVAMLHNEYDIVVADGEFNGDGHWFNIATIDGNKYIVDIGNNLQKKALDSGRIEPVVLPYPASSYKVDEIIHASQYINKIYPTIKNY